MREGLHRFPAGGGIALLLCGCAVAVAAAEDEVQVPEAAEVCLSCHAIGADDPVLVGPTLWGVVGRPVAGDPDFDYSQALRQQQGTWERERLDRWLTSPQAFAPGTLMTLGGVRSAADRKVVIDFLETLSAKDDD